MRSLKRIGSRAPDVWCHLVVVVTLLGVSLNAAEPVKPPKVLNVLLLAGQSNMAGADAIIADPPGFESTAADRESLFTSRPVLDDTKSRLYYPWGPVRGHLSINERYGEKQVHGPEVGLVRGLFEKGWRDLAVIKVYGNFKRDAEAWPWGEGGEYYKRWTTFVDDRLAELKQRGYEYRIVGFVWHQGIDDAIHGKLATQYEKNLSALIGALRKRYATETTPFVLARSVNSPIARNISGAGENDPMAIVRRAQVKVMETVPHCAWVNVDDQPNVAQHHFTATGQLVIGQRFADAIVKIAGM
jgi:hypothetical protein